VSHEIYGFAKIRRLVVGTGTGRQLPRQSIREWVHRAIRVTLLGFSVKRHPEESAFGAANAPQLRIQPRHGAVTTRSQFAGGFRS
jgi:hypothetical protein